MLIGVPVSISVCPKPYDQSKVPPSYLKGSSPFTYTLSNSSFMFVTPSSSTVQSTLPLAPPSYHHHINQYQQPTDRWWDSLELPGMLNAVLCRVTQCDALYEVDDQRFLILILVNEKRRCRDGNASLKSTETREELSTTCNPKMVSYMLFYSLTIVTRAPQ